MDDEKQIFFLSKQNSEKFNVMKHHTLPITTYSVSTFDVKVYEGEKSLYTK